MACIQCMLGYPELQQDQATLETTRQEPCAMMAKNKIQKNQSTEHQSHLMLSNGPFAGLKENGIVVPGWVLFLDTVCMPLMGTDHRVAIDKSMGFSLVRGLPKILTGGY